MHLAGVYWAGRLAGASHQIALRAALASQSLDDSALTSAPGMKVLSALTPTSDAVLLPLDKNPLMRGANNAHALNVSRSRSEVVARQGIHRKNELLFGLGLHTVGDFLPHANESGKPTVGHQEGRNEDFTESRWHMHDADFTYKNPRKALATFERFRELWTQFEGTEKRALSKSEVKQVEAFIYARDWKQMNEAFSKAGGITKEEKDEVIRLMNDKEARISKFDKLAASEKGRQAATEASSVWDYFPNDELVSFRKIDIAPYVNDKKLPAIADPYYKPTERSRIAPEQLQFERSVRNVPKEAW